ncbi:MAG TPA: hypothetical protein VFZ59_17890 [Verrucomicrobiae bacterium]|nr:hypothetical protein [Verrucomicrobiae bacterium]
MKIGAQLDEGIGLSEDGGVGGQGTELFLKNPGVGIKHQFGRGFVVLARIQGGVHAAHGHHHFDGGGVTLVVFRDGLSDGVGEAREQKQRKDSDRNQNHDERYKAEKNAGS